MNCFDCGGAGHIARDCPNKAYISDGRPMWCGTCDERTRHVQASAAGDAVKRCDCHPDSHKLLPQHRRCPDCRAIIYAWDTAGCGMHQPVGVHLPMRPPPAAEPARDLRALAAEQLAEFGASRPVL